MSDLNLEAIKARCAAATEGPWTVVIHAYEDDASLHILRSDGANVAMSSHDGDPLAFLSADDGEFIAAARTDVPALVAEVERLRSDLAECYRITGADPDGDDDAMLAQKAVAAVKRLREESDTEAETADKRIAELEAAVSDAMVVIADMAPGETVLIDRLRSLLAKGGAA